MKINLTAKHLSLLLLLSLFGGNAEAGRHEDDYRVVESRDCCPISSCYECSCNPLYCGAIDLELQAGVDPIIWRQRDDINALVPGVATPVVDFASGPRFRTLFKVPFVVGGQVGYAWSDNTRVYVEFNYVQARGKHDVALTLTPAVAPATALATAFTVTPGKYKLFDGYVGARYYWDRWCDRVSFFLGGKVGFTHHKGISFAGAVTAPAVGAAAPVVTALPVGSSFASRNTVVSGGGHIGMDYCFGGNWSFVITGEIVASGGPRVDRDLVLTPVVAPAVNPFYGLSIGGVQTELRFPITAGFRYSF